ncbi:adenosylcobinamide-phosphate guanylyltransferase [Halorientalis persicus]|uniref:Adenosylcobinamide-phosphate guanylyltransferase n=1 Tax=Halorientalis persicus TaxID=1367881 RepID=A0A1H8SWE7_9EURY|nr:NTP transferase domain-containing protein [Halorientalis persicus]SEO82654.1 adenosylcobinamide-phosphate guanylyltransferase [Halorientalis persicus]
MCGGRGTRLDVPVEKPLYRVAGRPMVDRVHDALTGSEVDSVVAAVSPHTPETATSLRERGVAVVDTPGEGYVADLDAALSTLSRPAVTCVADLPLLSSALVDEACEAARNAAADSLTVAVPADLKRRLGVSVDTSFREGGRELAPTGLNVVGGDEGGVWVTSAARLAVNVNRPTDGAVAGWLAARLGQPKE